MDVISVAVEVAEIDIDSRIKAGVPLWALQWKRSRGSKCNVVITLINSTCGWLVLCLEYLF